MKIALIVPGGVDRSGEHRVIPALLWLIERLARSHEVHVYALHQEPRPGQWSLAGARVCNAGRRPRRLRTLGALLREHRRGRFDVVHAFWAGGPGVVGALFGWLTRVRTVLTLPGGDLVAMPEIGYGARLGWRGRFWTDLALAGAGTVIMPSEWSVAQACALGVAALCVPYGVALDRWSVVAPRRRIAGEPLRLLHVASLNRVKDQATLLRALVRLRTERRDVMLDVVGEDVLGGTVQALAHDLDVADLVRFHGFVPHTALPPFYHRADLLVMSSRHEGVPIALLEAAVAGIPCVGTRVGAIADWHGTAAIAVAIGDHIALADAIARIDEDDDLRMSLAHSAQQCATDWDADRFAATMLSLYARRTLA